MRESDTASKTNQTWEMFVLKQKNPWWTNIGPQIHFDVIDKHESVYIKHKEDGKIMIIMDFPNNFLTTVYFGKEKSLS